MTTHDMYIKRDQHGQVGASTAALITDRKMHNSLSTAASVCTHHLLDIL